MKEFEHDMCVAINMFGGMSYENASKQALVDTKDL